MEVFSLIPGIILVVGGLGFLFVDVDEKAWQKDHRRFGTPSPRNLFSPYFLVRFDAYRIASAIIMLLLGGIFLAHGFGFIHPPY